MCFTAALCTQRVAGSYQTILINDMASENPKVLDSASPLTNGDVSGEDPEVLAGDPQLPNDPEQRRDISFGVCYDEPPDEGNEIITTQPWTDVEIYCCDNRENGVLRFESRCVCSLFQTSGIPRVNLTAVLIKINVYSAQNVYFLEEGGVRHMPLAHCVHSYWERFREGSVFSVGITRW